MTRRTWIIVGGVVLLGAAGATTRRRVTPVPAAAPPAEPVLMIDPRELDIGTVWEASDFVRELTVRNPSAETRVVTAVAGSCTCQRFSPTAFTLPPGGSQVVRVTLDLHAQLPRSDPKPDEPFAASVWAAVAGEPSAIYWRMRGLVRRTLQAPDRIDLGAVSDRSPAAAEQRLPLRSLAGPLDALRVEANSPWVRAAVSPGARQDVFALTVTPVAGLARRAYATSLTFTPVRVSGEVLPPVSIPVVFEVDADVQAVPAAVQLGGREVGQPARDTVALRSVGGGAFRVRGVRSSSPALTARPLEHAGATVYELTHAVPAAGAFDAVLTFDVDAAGEAIAVAVPVRGYGYAG